MNQREKILAATVGSVVLLFASGFGLRALLVKPLKEIDKKTPLTREARQNQRSAAILHGENCQRPPNTVLGSSRSSQREIGRNADQAIPPERSAEAVSPAYGRSAKHTGP